MFRKLFLAAALLCAPLLSSPAQAIQNTACMPLTGIVSGVAFATDINNGFASVISNYSGTSAPTGVDCSAAAVTGMLWYDTSVSPPRFKIYDGSTWNILGYNDNTNHIWLPQVGGGVTTLASAATVDICNAANPQSYINISGNTNISSFGTACATGQIKHLHFNSAGGQLTYGATSIITPTAQSYTWAAGDQVDVTYLGSGNGFIVSDVLGVNNRLIGVVDGSAAAAGFVRERIGATWSSLSLSSSSVVNGTSISLTAGDWDVYVTGSFVPNGGNLTTAIVGISTTSATFAGATADGDPLAEVTYGAGNGGTQILNTAWRVNVSAATTVYAVVEGIFSGTCTSAGAIWARRR
jgi:hypothetical protein